MSPATLHLVGVLTAGRLLPRDMVGPPMAVVEAVSRFAQGVGQVLGVSSPMLHLSPIEVCCP